MTVVDFHERVRQLLSERDWNTYKLAKVMGVSQTTIDSLLKRDTFPKFETILAICNALDIKVGDFFGFDTTVNFSIMLTPDDVKLIELKHSLSKSQLLRLMGYLEALKTEGIHDI
ncbi:MAG: helix-turn-helix transcriptional regulator [Lachnospiraceae bacterium]|nr:helix-turn-helix transcriptional regulator [Lachnospiraceae bacterium]